MASAASEEIEILEKAKAEAMEEKAKILASATMETEQERNQMLEVLRKQVGGLALQGAEQILMREVDEQSHRDVLDKLSSSL